MASPAALTVISHGFLFSSGVLLNLMISWEQQKKVPIHDVPEFQGLFRFNRLFSFHLLFLEELFTGTAFI